MFDYFYLGCEVISHAFFQHTHTHTDTQRERERENKTCISQINGKAVTDFLVWAPPHAGLGLCWCVARQQSKVIISLAVSIRFNFSSMLDLPKCLVSVMLRH